MLCWVPGGWKEIHTALNVWADIDLAGRPVADDSILLQLLRGIILDRLAGLGIDTFGPVHILGVLRRADERAVGAIQCVEKAVAAEMAQHFARLAVDRHVIDHLRADLVIIVFVVWR